MMISSLSFCVVDVVVVVVVVVVLVVVVFVGSGNGSTISFPSFSSIAVCCAVCGLQRSLLWGTVHVSLELLYVCMYVCMYVFILYYSMRWTIC
jgi:hypothetical protein